MKIALSTPAWPGESTANGITTAVVMLAKGLLETGHQPIVLSGAPYSGPDRNVISLIPERPGALMNRLVAKFTAPDEHQHRNIENRVLAAAQIAIRRHGAEVLLMEETFGWAGHIQKRLDIPVVSVLHGPYCIVKEWMSDSERGDLLNRNRELREGLGLAASAGILGLAPHALKQTLDRYGLHDIPQATIPNAIRLGSEVNHAELDDASRRRLLFIGRFDYRKGGDLVLAAFAELIRNGGDAHLTFVGPDYGVASQDGTFRVDMPQALTALPDEVRKRIDYRGPRSKQEIEELRQRHGVAIVASRYENFPYTLIESLSAGVATIATDVGGHPEIIDRDVTGLLVPTDDPVAMARACQRLISDPALCHRLGTAARADMAARLSPATVARQVVAFLESVVRSFSAGR